MNAEMEGDEDVRWQPYELNSSRVQRKKRNGANDSFRFMINLHK